MRFVVERHGHRSLMAGSRAGIPERLARLRNKLPVIALGMERQFQDAKGIVIAHFAVGLGNSQWPMRVLPAGTDHELADAVLRVWFSTGVLRRKALVVVIMPADDNFYSRMIKRVPQGLHRGIVSVITARAE